MNERLLELQAGEIAAAQDEAGLQGPSPVMALHDVLDAAAASLVAAERQDYAGAGALLLEAHVAAMDAFPWDSPASEALGVVLAEVGTMVSGVTA